jgi:hypothetical protein
MAGRFGSLKFYDDDMKKALRGATPKLDRVKLDTSSTNVLGGVARVAGTFAEQMRKANEKKVAKERSKMRSALLRAYMAPKKVFDPTAGEAPIMDDDAPEEMPEVSQYDDAEAAFNEANPSGMEAALRAQSEFVPPESGMFGPGDGAYAGMGDKTIDELSLLEYNNRLAEEERERELAGTIDAERRKQANAMALEAYKQKNPRDPSGREAAGLQYKREYDRILKDPKGGTPEERQKRADEYIRMFVNTAILNQGGQYSFRADAAKRADPARKVEGPTVPIGLKPGEKPDVRANQERAKVTANLTATNNVEQYNVATASYDNQRKNYDLINHLETSDARTGLGAEFLTGIDRAKAFVGDMVAAGRVTDTEILDVSTGSQVFPLIKSLGIGARGMDTPAEREFMRKVLTGTIGLSKKTLLRMARMRVKESGFQISNWNKKVESGELDNFFKYSGIPKGIMKQFPNPQESAAENAKLKNKWGLK